MRLADARKMNRPNPPPRFVTPRGPLCTAGGGGAVRWFRGSFEAVLGPGAEAPGPLGQVRQEEVEQVGAAAVVVGLLLVLLLLWQGRYGCFPSLLPPMLS